MIAWLKANPGKGTMGSVGVAGPSDISAIFFQQQTGTSFQLVPYRGGAPLLQDLVGGQIDLGLFQVSAFLEQLKSGQLKAYTVLSKQPDGRPLPTFRRSTRRAFRASTPRSGTAIWAPKGTPKDVDRQAQRVRCRRRWPTPRVKQALRRPRPGHLAARAADAGGARRAPEGRDRKMVADHQSGEYHCQVDRPAIPTPAVRARRHCKERKSWSISRSATTAA